MTEPLNRRTSEPAYTYRNLAIWRQAQDLAQTILTLVDQLPASARSTEVLARQIIRAASSVPANIAEGHGRFGPASYRNHLSIAKGSACEVDSWLDLFRRLSVITAEREAELHSRYSALIGALTGRMRDLEKLIKEDRAVYTVADEPMDGSEVQRFRGSAP